MAYAFFRLNDRCWAGSKSASDRYKTFSFFSSISRVEDRSLKRSQRPLTTLSPAQSSQRYSPPESSFLFLLVVFIIIFRPRPPYGRQQQTFVSLPSRPPSKLDIQLTGQAQINRRWRPPPKGQYVDPIPRGQTPVNLTI